MAQPVHRLNRAELARANRNIRRLPEGCWEWTGPLNRDGYGLFQRSPGQRPRIAHRIIWEHFHDQPIPDGMQLDHRCHTDAVTAGTCQGGACRHRRCVNPDHVEAVTASENTLRQDHANRRKTHCPHGHEYTPENTYVKADGKRRCRTCIAAARL